MIPCTNDGLIKFLQAEKLEPILQKESGQVYVVLKINTQDFPVFFRIYEGQELLQILIFFPLQVRKERFDAMARMLHLLNKEIDLPGFGMDEAIGLVFHRVMIPIFDKKIDAHLLRTLFSASPKICEKFFPSIVGTATSDLSFEAIIKKSQVKGS